MTEQQNEHEALFKIDEKPGLPDNVICDKPPRVDIARLASYLGLGRSERKAMGKEPSKSFKLYFDPKTRLRYLVHNITQVFSCSTFTKKITPSFELIALSRFDPNWYTANGPACQACRRVDESAQESLRQVASIRIENAFKGQTIVPGLRERISTIGAEMNCFIGVYQLVKEALPGYVGAVPDRQMAILNAAFACSTLFGQAVLDELMEMEPLLKEGLTIILGTCIKIEDDEPIEGDRATPYISEEVTLSSLPSISTFPELYEKISALMLSAQEDPESAVYAQEISILLNDNLPKLLIANELTTEQVKNIIDGFVTTLSKLGIGQSLMYFQEQDFLEAFGATWGQHFQALFGLDLEQGHLINLLQQRQLAAGEAAALLSEDRTAVASADELVAGLQQQLAQATFRDRARITEALSEAQTQQANAQRTLMSRETQCVNSLLPDGQTLESMINETLPFDAAECTPAVRRAIRAYADFAATHQEWRTPQDESVSIPNTLPNATTGDQATPRVALPSSKPETVMATTDADVPSIAALSGSSPMPESVTASAITERSLQPLVLVTSTEIASEDLPDGELTETSQDEAFGITSFVSEPEVLQSHWGSYYQQTGRVSPVAIENVALLWLDRGYLNIASRILDLASDMSLEGETLPPGLVRAAHLGMHVWKSDATYLRDVLAFLEEISPEKFAHWVEHRPGGKVVPFLVFAAAFQPAVFFGNLTGAPRLLRLIANQFETPVARLIDELVNFVDRGHRLDVETLRNLPRTDEKTVRAKLSREIREWRDRVTNKQTGWAPARMAMVRCLDREPFKSAIDAIENDTVDARSSGFVADLVSQYRDEPAIVELMNACVEEAMGYHHEAPHIEGNARKWFLKVIAELVAFGDRWLEEIHQSSTRSDEMGHFSKRFVTMLPAALDSIQRFLDRSSEVDQHAGLTVVCRLLGDLVTVAGGNNTPMWTWPQTRGWMELPLEWGRLQQIGPDELTEISYYLHRLSDFDPDAVLNTTRNAGQFRLAMLIALYCSSVLGRQMATVIDEIDRAFNEKVRGCLLRCQNLITLLDNANVTSLLNDTRHYQLTSEVDHLREQLQSMSVLDDINPLVDEIERLYGEQTRDFSARTTELTQELEQLVARARREQEPNFVSESWIEHVRGALRDYETTVAEEMLEHLKTALEKSVPLVDDDTGHQKILQRFLTDEAALQECFKRYPNPRELPKALASSDFTNLSFASLPTGYKRAIEALMHKSSKNHRLDQSLYDTIVAGLAGIGLDTQMPPFNAQLEASVHFKVFGRIATLGLQVKRANTGRGIMFFSDQKANTQRVTLLIAPSEWDLAELTQTIEDNSINTSGQQVLLLSRKVLTLDERNAFATYCKRGKHTVFHADPMLVATLAGLGIPEHDRFKYFLQLSLPWTYANPYTGNQMQPAPKAMRYGRVHDLKQLTQMAHGAAMIYGGRQLGKSTLLNEAVDSFNKPQQGQHAALFHRDGKLRANLSGDELEKHRDWIIGDIFQAAVEAGMIRGTNANISSNDKLNELAAYFRKPNCESLLVCFDEMDRILAIDASLGFPLFRELSGLVNNSNYHFKVVIAGLENVRRFADAPNYPLHQLGTAIQVSIMEPNEALQLIKEPLGYLGYQFDSPVLTNRILVETNRHPGLIHLFVHTLINHLSSRHQGRVGTVTITADDIELVRKNDELRRLIRDRFDITLALDDRYKLIAYSIIRQGGGSFSPSRAKAIVEEWAPEIFAPMSEGQFDAFLEELCGLGVLHRLSTNQQGYLYALRNANILNLVGGQEKISDKLLETMERIQNTDPMSGHAFNHRDKDAIPSPLTLRDEKMLISVPPVEKPAKGIVIRADSSAYSVGIVAGSEALGLKTTWFEKSLPALGEEESPLPKSKAIRYFPISRKDTDIQSANDFRRLLVENIIETRSQREPVMLFVEITGERPLVDMLDMLDIAHAARSALPKNPHHRVRVLFLLSPKALWEWRTQPVLTQGRDNLQPFVFLSLWEETALAHLLNGLNLENTSTAVSLLKEYSAGWYFSLDALLTAKREKKLDAVKLTEFGAAYQRFDSFRSRQWTDFLQRAGVYTFPWVEPLLRELAKQQAFEQEDVAIYLLDIPSGATPLDATTVLQWLSDLRLILPRRGDKQKRLYRVERSIVPGLKIPAVNEQRA